MLYFSSFIHFISLDLRQHLDLLESSSRSARELANIAARAAEGADHRAEAFRALFCGLQTCLSDAHLSDNFTPHNILRVLLGRDPSPQDLATIDPPLLKLISNLANQSSGA